MLVAFLLVNAPNCHLSLVLASVVQGDAVNCNIVLLYLIAAAVEVAVRAVTLLYFFLVLLFRCCTCLLVLFRLLLIALALIEDDKFFSVYGYCTHGI